MNYRTGKTEELEMISGFNSDDWCHDDAELPDDNSVWGWVKKEGGPCGHAGLITTKWENPHPNDWIETIDIVSLELGSVPIIPAITLGEATLAVDSCSEIGSHLGQFEGTAWICSSIRDAQLGLNDCWRGF